MKKIGIISELTISNSVNYGNKIQGYALNKYLNDNFSEYDTYSIILSKNQKMLFTKFYMPPFLYDMFINLKLFLKRFKKNRTIDLIRKREKTINCFVKKHIKLYSKIVKYNDFKKMDFDYYIVGSDVVWAQNDKTINKIKFLKFNTKKEIKKISYAASFGRDYIPKNNVKYIKEYLSDYYKISLREKSSVKMLNDIGINDVYHVCDPALLLTKEEWSSIEINPNITNEKYIFVYLLGKSSEQREYINKFAKNNKLRIINIPHANGKYNQVDDDFGDYKYNDCSVENWIWLIHNADYVFTDSFHGLVLSSIFQKKFIVVKRLYDVDINNRIIDYLSTIHQEDKFLTLEKDLDLKKIKWDYIQIKKELEIFISNSKNYLENALNNK